MYGRLQEHRTLSTRRNNQWHDSVSGMNQFEVLEHTLSSNFNARMAEFEWKQEELFRSGNYLGLERVLIF